MDYLSASAYTVVTNYQNVRFLLGHL